MMSKVEKKLRDGINESLFEFAEYDDEASKRGGYSNYSYWKSTWNVFLQNKVAVFLMGLMVVLLLFTLFQPYLPNQKSPTKIYNDAVTNLQLRNSPPDSEFWFGTNSIGQDIWSRIWNGSRTSLLIGVTVGIWEAVVGIIVGALWGYIRWLDRPITEIYNVIDNIPKTIILVLLTYIMRPGLGTMIFAMCLTGWIYGPFCS